jgi:prophage DNA circulation protein
MDEELKLTAEVMQSSGGWVDRPTAIDRLHEAITRLHAEIEALKSDVSDLVRAGSDEATENERLVKERDEALADNAKLRMMMEAREKLGEAFGVDMHKNATEAALEFAQREIDAIARAETAEAQRDAALKALKEADEALCDYACATDDVPCKRSASQCNEMCGEPAVFARQAIARASRTLDTVKEKT